ncbi:hypothetical protein OXYTRIMIC_755 [Oxytricha trifallax]|uniref:Uncharacterized protein n=1 Tax=Oxytricha trifallax TaxID=1172189 RepID=A0A073HXM3_9SPIT|nr:hypothetical protein OXYTRIMIC_755 [Oxytricha trifallax]
MDSSSDLSSGPQEQIQQQAPLGKGKAYSLRDILEVKIIRNAIHARSQMKTVPKESLCRWSIKGQCMLMIEPELSPLSVRRCQGSQTIPTRISTRKCSQIGTWKKGQVQVKAKIQTSILNIPRRIAAMETLTRRQAHARDRREDVCMSEEEKELYKEGQTLQKYDQEIRMRSNLQRITKQTLLKAQIYILKYFIYY